MNLPAHIDPNPQLFVLQDPLANTAFRGSTDPYHGWELARAERVPRTPVRVVHRMGSILRDFLWAEFYPLINDRTVSVLTAGQFSGWSTYPVEVYDKRGGRVTGYHGLSILGRCQQITLDKEHSSVVYEENPRGRFPYYQGLFISMDSWDGKDLFMAGDRRTAHIVVTARVVKAFRKSRVTNLRLVPVQNVRVYATDQPKFLVPTPARTP